jgi:hypothetical protein
MPNITYTSTPDYDEWGYDTSWTCDDYMTWHKAMVLAYGAEMASLIWLKYWAYNANGVPTGFDSTDWCSSSPTFAAYFQSYGIDIGNSYSDAVIAAEAFYNKAVGYVTTAIYIALGAGALYMTYNFLKETGYLKPVTKSIVNKAKRLI